MADDTKRIAELEAEVAELREVLKLARKFFIAGWRHHRPTAYIAFRQRMNGLLGIPPDYDMAPRPPSWWHSGQRIEDA